MKKVVLILCALIIVAAAAYYLYPRPQMVSTQSKSSSSTVNQVSSSTQVTSTTSTISTDIPSQTSIDNWYQSYIGTSSILSVVPLYQASQNPDIPSPSKSYSFTYNGKNYSVSSYEICGPAGCTGSVVELGNQKIYQTQALIGIGGIIANQGNLYIILNDDNQNYVLILNSNMSLSSVVIAFGKEINPPNVIPPSVEQILEQPNG